METVGGIGLIVGLAVLAVIVLLIMFLVSRRSRTRRVQERRERTREEFGAEYERTIREQGSEAEAERELRQRRGRVERQLRPLSDDSRQRYEERWGEVERLFVENPERSIEMADRVIYDLLDERNFVSDAAQDDLEIERRLATMYPRVADDYREARTIRADVVARASRASNEGSGGGRNENSTEELRQAIRKYRAVYERLVQG